MRIGSEIIGGFLLSSFFIKLDGIRFLFSSSKIIFFQCFFRLVSIYIGETVPAPLALSAKWHAFAVLYRESLQTGNIHGIGEFAISNGK